MSLASLGLRSLDLGSLDGRSLFVVLIEGPMESLDDSKSDDSLSYFKGQDEGVSDFSLREDPGSLLAYLHAG